MVFRVNVDDPTDPAKVKVYGPGVEPGVKAAKPVWFTVDCTKAGKHELNLLFPFLNFAGCFWLSQNGLIKNFRKSQYYGCTFNVT